jgi:hypothetical protein
MTLHTKTSDRTATEFHKTLATLGLAQCRVARWFAVSARCVRRWEHGDRRIPHGIAIVIRLLSAGAVTAVQVEEAAAAIPAPVRRINGGGEPSTLLVESPPEPEQSALACAEAAALVDPGPTTVVEQVCALTAGTCHWPLGDPRRPSFCFCNAPVVTAPYCEAHRTLAYSAPRTGSGHGVRVGFVAHASAHGSPTIPGAFSATGASPPPISQAALPRSHTAAA